MKIIELVVLHLYFDSTTLNRVNKYSYNLSITNQNHILLSYNQLCKLSI